MNDDVPRTDILDHIVYRAETGNLDSGIDRFRSLGFNVIPGGTHSDGLTSNALVILSDGIYIEIIAFLHDPSYYPPGSQKRLERENHPWANRNVGWLEYAHLDTAPATAEPSNTYDIINKRAPPGVGNIYNPPMAGGRKTLDDVQLKWTVTLPANLHQRGKIPFFCQDLTPRQLRVPTDPLSNLSHTNRAKGIASITLLTSDAEFQKQVNILTAVLGLGPEPNPNPNPNPNPDSLSTSSSDHDTTSTSNSLTERALLAEWALSRPNDQASTFPTLQLRVPQKGNTLEEEFMLRTGGGVAQVTFWTQLGPVQCR